MYCCIIIDEACGIDMVTSPCNEDIPSCVSTFSICDGITECPGGEDEALCLSQRESTAHAQYSIGYCTCS